MKMNSSELAFAGTRIQQARKVKHYTQSELGEMINMSDKNVSRLENGTMGFSVQTLVALCKALDVSSDYILFGNEAKNQSNPITLMLSKLPQQKQHQAEKLLQIFIDSVTE